MKEKDSSNIISAIKQGTKLVTLTKDINEIFQQYYKKLYTSRVSGNEDQINSFFSNINMPKFNLDQARKLESSITVAEIRKAVSLMNTGKSPGYDGFPVEYYKEYIDILAPVLVKVYQEAFEKGHMPPTFNEALISLIPKKDRDITDPSIFRPISLLNLDFKILTILTSSTAPTSFTKYYTSQPSRLYEEQILIGQHEEINTSEVVCIIQKCVNSCYFSRCRKGF